MNKTSPLDDLLTEIGATDKSSIERRNQRLLQFFQKIHGEDHVMLIGDPNKPAVIYIPEKGKAISLSCYVHNFTLIFTDKTNQGNHIHSVTLTDQASKNPDVDSILEILNNSFHREVHRVKIKGTDLYLSGYNFQDRTREETKYPVFSRYGMKIYFNKETAEGLVEQFSGYNLIVD